MSVVFVVQQQERINILPAKKYGSLQQLLSPNLNIQLDASETVKDLRERLAGFSDRDYILPIGDPVAIGLTIAIALEVNQGRCKVLKWDRQEHEYYEVNIQL